jgi:hypothetical protein
LSPVGEHNWDNDRLRVGPWVAGLDGRHREEPVDALPRLRGGIGTAGRRRARTERYLGHDPVRDPQGPAASAPEGVEPHLRHGDFETMPSAAADVPTIPEPGHRPAARRLWVTGAIVVAAAAVAIPVALRSSTPEPARQGGTIYAVASATTAAAADPLPTSTSTPTPEGSASRAASHPSQSTTPVKYGPVGYEAEAPSNILTGAASVTAYPGSSDGQVVANIGRWGPGAKRTGTLSFPNVTAPRDGVFTLTLYLVGNTDPAAQTAVISVAGTAAASVTAPAGSTCCVIRAVRVALKKGTNTIDIGNPQGRAPSVDRLIVSQP